MAIVIDLDDPIAAANYEQKCRQAPLPLLPTAVVETSSIPTPRYQLVFALGEPCIDIPKWRDAAGRLAHWFGADPCSTDPAHVWRVPCTTNWPNQKKQKSGRAPEQSKLVAFDAQRAFDLDDLIEHLPAIQDSSRVEIVQLPTPTRSDLSRRWQGVSEMVGMFPPFPQKEMIGDTPCPGIDRSELDFAICKEACRMGWTWADVVYLYSEAKDTLQYSCFIERLQEKAEAGGHERAERYLSRTFQKAKAELAQETEARAKSTAESPQASNEIDELALKVCSLGDFLARDIAPRKKILAPWLPERGLAMVAAPRGAGKTHFALGCAFAIASGGEFLGFKCAQPEPVLYVDGEMDPSDLQGCLQELYRTTKRDNNGDPDLALANLCILTHADQELGIPDLADDNDAGRRRIEAAAITCTVIVLDNLSTLCRSGVENEAESWTVVQEWLVKLRRNGKSVILIHHTGKPGQNGGVSQRGTSKREDILDTSILLQRPADAEPGLHFTVKFTKARSFVTSNLAAT